MFVRSRFALVLCAVAASLGHARAQFTNPSFETGSLTGWNVIGETSASGTLYAMPPSEGQFQAFLGTGATAVMSDPLNAFFGLSAGTLDTALGITATVGSGLSQSVTVGAGDQMTFRWNFQNTEAVPTTTWNDTAFAVIDGTVIELADTATAIDANLNTGYTTYTHTFSNGGTFLVGAGVANSVDESFDSALLVDAYVVAPVPEPGLLGLVAVPLIAWYRRGRKTA